MDCCKLLMHPGSRSAAASEDINRDKDDRINCNPDTNSTEGSDDETAIITDESEDNEDALPIKGSYDIFKIVWRDTNGEGKQMKEMEGAKLNIYVNTSANTAMFMLSTYITLKGSRRKSNKQQVYLLIPPERIKTITKACPTIHNDYALHFSLIQGPDCVGPQDRHTDSKRATEEQLALFLSLAMVTELTLHLAISDTVAGRRKDFERLATVFSLKNTKNRPCKDKQYGNPATLYAGKGGKVISVDESPGRAEASPPPYPGAALRSPLRSLHRSKKRRLTSNEHREPNLEKQSLEEKRRRPNIDDDAICMLQTLISGIHTRLDHLENQFNTRLLHLENESKTRFDDLKIHSKTCFDDVQNQFETRFDDVKIQLETHFNTLENPDAGYTPCRYDSAERDGILQAVEDKCQDCLDKLKWISDEALDDIEEKRRKAVDEIGEEHREAKADLREDIGDMKTRIIEAVGRI